MISTFLLVRTDTHRSTSVTCTTSDEFLEENLLSDLYRTNNYVYMYFIYRRAPSRKRGIYPSRTIDLGQTLRIWSNRVAEPV